MGSAHGGGLGGGRLDGGRYGDGRLGGDRYGDGRPGGGKYGDGGFGGGRYGESATAGWAARLRGGNFLTRTNFIREGLPKGGHSSTHTRGVP